MLISLADEYDVELDATAKSYSNNPDHIQDTNRLVQWYTKNGFDVIDGDDEYGFNIVYYPK